MKRLWADVLSIAFVISAATQTWAQQPTSTSSSAMSPPTWQNPFQCGVPAPAPGKANSPTGTPPQPTFFDNLSACGLSLQNSINNNTQGASFGQSETAGSSGFKSQFALIYRSAPFYRSPESLLLPGPHLIADVDGNLNSSSAASERNSYLNARLEVGNDFLNAGQSTTSLQNVPELQSISDFYVRAGGVYETTQDGAVSNFLFEAASSMININSIAFLPTLGKFTPLFSTGLEYQLQPYLTLQTGPNLNGLTDSREFNPTRLRLTGEPILSFRIANPTKIFNLGLAEINLTIDDSYTVDPLEGKTILIGKVYERSPLSHNLFNASLSLGVGNLSIGPSYSNGQTPPLYKQSSTFSMNLKLAFGGGAGPHVSGNPSGVSGGGGQ